MSKRGSPVRYPDAGSTRAIYERAGLPCVLRYDTFTALDIETSVPEESLA